MAGGWALGRVKSRLRNNGISQGFSSNLMRTPNTDATCNNDILLLLINTSQNITNDEANTQNLVHIPWHFLPTVICFCKDAKAFPLHADDNQVR